MSDARSTDAPDEPNEPDKPNGVIALLTNVPNETLARHMGAYLVEQKLAACVNILGACESVYRWQGKVETAREIPLLIKTTQGRFSEVEAAIIHLHPITYLKLSSSPSSKVGRRILAGYAARPRRCERRKECGQA